VVKGHVIEARDGAAVATSILTTFLETSPVVTRSLEKGGWGSTGHPSLVAKYQRTAE
jgi:hypothetical protein